MNINNIATTKYIPSLHITHHIVIESPWSGISTIDPQFVVITASFQSFVPLLH